MSSTTTTVLRFLPEPVQYHPGQRRDKETSKRIRAHIAENLRRKKRQLLLNPQRPREGISLDGTFCACTVLQPPTTPLETGNTISRAVQKQRAIADSYKICQRCHKLKFTELSWSGQLKAARARIPSVSPFLEAEFDPFQSLPELSSYKKSTITSRSLNEFKAHMITYWSYDVLRSQVLPVAAKEPALFMGLLYSSCAHLNAMKGCGETPLSMAIKAEAMRQINIRLDDPDQQNTSVTIASIAYLASGVWAYGSPTAAQEVQAHEDGMMLVFSRGMNWAIPEGDSVGQALLKCLALHECTRAATLGVPILEPWVVAFCQPSRIISDVEFLPESPLYCPRRDFYSVSKSPRCSDHTLRVLRGVRRLVDLIVDNHVEFDYDTIRTDLMGMPSATTGTEKQVYGDYIYESCRLAALAMIEAIDARTPFVNIGIPIVDQLKSALQKTDIGHYWGNMSGVLFWISMVGMAAAIGKPQHCFMSSVLARGDHELAYGNTVFEGATIAAYRFERIHLRLIDSETHGHLVW